MTDRERLIELFSPFADGTYNSSGTIIDGTKVDDVVDSLLANGVIVPPCKVGDIVYYIFEGEIRELTVISLSYMFSENIKHFNLHTTNYRGAVLSYEIKNVGKTVFLTKSQAEEALKNEQEKL